jgi:pyocin large subunit-like protein
MRKRSVWLGAGLAVSLAALAACDERLATQAAREHRPAEAVLEGASFEAPAAREGAAQGARAGDTATRAPARLVQGRPMWADSRRYTAEENVAYQFEHHGAELGARDVDDFVAKAHRFVNSPPDGVLSITRANGDRLLYDPKSKIFGVVRSDGAPRTVFKPEDGEAYWKQQTAEAGGAQRASNRRASRADAAS